MSDLPRYAIFGKSAIDPSADIVVMTGCDGEWVRYSDAAAKTAALQAELKGAHAEIRLLTHKVITCGVAAAHPDAELSTKRAYGSKWDSPQAQSVRKLRAERDSLQAECARLRAFHYAWDGQVAHIYLVGGDTMLDLYNAAHKAALRGKESK